MSWRRLLDGTIEDRDGDGPIDEDDEAVLTSDSQSRNSSPRTWGWPADTWAP